jgi:hypothetical protein
MTKNLHFSVVKTHRSNPDSLPVPRIQVYLIVEKWYLDLNSNPDESGRRVHDLGLLRSVYHVLPDNKTQGRMQRVVAAYKLAIDRQGKRP